MDEPPAVAAPACHLAPSASCSDSQPANDHDPQPIGGRHGRHGPHPAGPGEQVRLEPSETEVHTCDHAGIRFDVAESECLYKGKTIAGRFRVTQVWGHRQQAVVAGRSAVHLPPVTVTRTERSGDEMTTRRGPHLDKPEGNAHA